MARFSGVTYQDIVNTANQIIGQGMQPTIEKIRHILGTGSSTTIANYLRKWRAEQDGSSGIGMKENLPQELIAMVKGLWEQLFNQAQIKIISIEAKHEEICTELKQELDKYKNNNQRWQQLYNQWIKEKAKLSHDKLALEQSIDNLQKNTFSLQAQLDAQVYQLKEKQERIDELHRLHHQVQINLEHYRESSREQRLLDQHQHEQQIQTYQTEIKALKEQLTAAREKAISLEQQYQLLDQTHLNLEKNYAKTTAELEKQRLTLIENEKIKNEFMQASLHWQNQYTVVQQGLETKSAQLINGLAEVKTSTQQLLTVQQALEEALSQNKLLDNERWVLAQEKAQLEGQLKQLQKISENN